MNGDSCLNTLELYPKSASGISIPERKQSNIPFVGCPFNILTKDIHQVALINSRKTLI